MGIIEKKELARVINNIQDIIIPLGKLSINDAIGEGGTSIVKRAKLDNLNKEFAVKFLSENLRKRESKQYKRFKQSFQNLFYLQYKLPIVPQLYFGHLDVENHIIPYTLMPYIPITLKKYRKNLDEKFNVNHFEKIFKILMNNIELFHQKNIIHRDLKPENVFIDEEKLLIGDFDISLFNDPQHIKLIETKTGERLANFAFSAPEQSNPRIGEIGNASDWFAFGQILYWLITQNTIKGQNPPSIKEINICWTKYDELINKLTKQNPLERLSGKDEIEKFLRSRDESYRISVRESKIIKSNEVFDELLRKNFPGKQRLFKINNEQKVQSLLNDLNNNIKETELYYRLFSRIGGDYNVLRIEKTKNQNDGDFWLINKYELNIENLWVYKDDVGYNFVVIEIKPMKTNEIFGEACESSSYIAAGYDNGNYINIEEYYDGYSEKYGKLSKEAELRERYIKKDLLVISPQFSSMYNAFENGGIQYLFEHYKENNFALKEEFFEKMIPPNVTRYISHLMPMGY